MRTTIDLPDELYRTLKVRAALNGMTLRELRSLDDADDEAAHARSARR